MCVSILKPCIYFHHFLIAYPAVQRLCTAYGPVYIHFEIIWCVCVVRQLCYEIERPLKDEKIIQTLLDSVEAQACPRGIILIVFKKKLESHPIISTIDDR